MHVQTAVDLTGLNSFGCQCIAQAFVTISTDEIDHLRAIHEWLSEHPGALLLGGGSNVLLAAPSLPAVAHLGVTGLGRVRPESTEKLADHEVLVRAGAAQAWHPFVQWTLAQGWFGLENLSLIPGTVGAAPVQNIGAYGVELSRFVDSVEAFDRQTQNAVRMTPAECSFAYRNSVFKQTPNRWIITAVQFRLSTQASLMLDYGQIREHLAGQKIAKPGPADVAEAVIRIRQKRLPDPAQLGNAGSFFKNPIVLTEQADRLRAQYPEIPVYPAAPGSTKLAAGWLIEQCGLKGKRSGDAGVHEAHALVLVNYGNASGQEILTLARTIIKTVQETFGVLLEPEPRIIEHA